MSEQKKGDLTIRVLAMPGIQILQEMFLEVGCYLKWILPGVFFAGKLQREG